MEKLSPDELNRLASRTVQDVISELSVADAAIDLLIHDEAVSLETRGKLSLLVEQIRKAAVPAKRFIMMSRSQESLRVIHLHEFFSDFAPLFRRLLPEGIDFKMELSPNLWATKVSVAEFEEAFITLIVNARDAMPKGGALQIRATNVDEAASQTISGLFLTGDHVLIKVIDNGLGIPPAHLKRIFDPFVITKGPVSGFGLAKAYSAIRNIDGHINVTSDIGKGTSFNVFVPRYMAERVVQSS